MAIDSMKSVYIQYTHYTHMYCSRFKFKMKSMKKKLFVYAIENKNTKMNKNALI